MTLDGNFNFEQEADLTLSRLWPRIRPLLGESKACDEFRARCERHFSRVFQLLYALYGQRYDFLFHVEQVLITVAKAYVARPADLKALDRARELTPAWFQDERMVGGVCYVDRFAGDLLGLKAEIPYFEELGLTYLHLMPIFRSPAGENDGGFAVSSYREIEATVGTVNDLRQVATELRRRGISLVLDFIFNHTSDEHEWALRALAGEAEYQQFYYMFEDRRLPDQYEQDLREIFPEQAPGNFTYRPDVGKWVWTTFHHYQWDLKYANPAVFTAMLGEMLFIANIGAEVLRLDAVAFIWKQMGTSGEGLPQAHQIVQAFNALVRIAAPATVFKSEAIVHPAEVATYIHQNEAPLSYNPTLMALLWESLATRQVTLLRKSMERYFALPENCAWVNYVRCHDDIGWTFADEDAAELGINGFDHRQFLNEFYTGRFEGSFARGLPFNYNPITRDARISGMCASLAGLEQALENQEPLYVEHALRRIELIHAVIMSVGGIPLIYLGDEIGMLNDYGYRQNPAQKEDSRSVHRPKFDKGRAKLRSDEDTVPGRLFRTLKRLIEIRKETPALADGQTDFFDTQNEHVLGYARQRKVFIYANFSERIQTLPLIWPAGNVLNLVSGKSYDNRNSLELDAYEYVWLVAR